MLIRETIMRKILNWPRLICQFFRADFLDISHQATGDASDEWKMRNLKRNGECRGISSVCRVLINRRWQPERNSLTSFTLDRWYPINFQIADPLKIGPRGGKDVCITPSIYISFLILSQPAGESAIPTFGQTFQNKICLGTLHKCNEIHTTLMRWWYIINYWG